MRFEAASSVSVVCCPNAARSFKLHALGFARRSANKCPARSTLIGGDKITARLFMSSKLNAARVGAKL